MVFYKFIFRKIALSIVAGFIILSSVLFIFSIIELLSDKYGALDTLVLGVINTIEFLTTIPTILFLMSVIIFWILLHKTNELLIIRHYLSHNKIIILFLVFIALFSLLEINKNKTQNYVKELKENYLTKNIYTDSVTKTFYKFEGDELSIFYLNGMNFNKKTVKEISIYYFKKGLFNKSITSNDSVILGRTIKLSNSFLITSDNIVKLKNDYIINISDISKNLFDNKSETIVKNKNFIFSQSGSLITNLALIVSLLIYVLIFTSKTLIKKNVETYKYVSVSLFLYLYIFLSSNIILENHDIIFHVLVLITTLTYMIKIKLNE